jgi:hypothetical protein
MPLQLTGKIDDRVSGLEDKRVVLEDADEDTEKNRTSKTYGTPLKDQTYASLAQKKRDKLKV